MGWRPAFVTASLQTLWACAKPYLAHQRGPSASTEALDRKYGPTAVAARRCLPACHQRSGIARPKAATWHRDGARDGGAYEQKEGVTRPLMVI